MSMLTRLLTATGRVVIDRVGEPPVWHWRNETTGLHGVGFPTFSAAAADALWRCSQPDDDRRALKKL